MIMQKSYQLFFTLFILFMLFTSIVNAQPVVNGYMQNTMIKSEDGKAFTFGFDRVRIGAKGKLNDLTAYKFQIDVTNSADEFGPDGSTPGIITFAEIDYKVLKAMTLSVGKFKTPIGMEWNTAATQLDFVKRGLGQAFIFHFDAGAMLHANNLGKPGFGFAAGVFNAGPNKATEIGDPQEGQDYTLAGRVNINPGKTLYGELYFGRALTSVSGQEDVQVFGGAVKSKLTSKLQVKAEYLTRDDVTHTGSDGTDYYVQAGYLVHPEFEPVFKYETLDVTDNSKDQANITLGLNIYLNPKVQKQSKIMINYVSSDLDGKDAFQMLYQVAF